MKPTRLIIEGVNSFIERQELDFTAVGRGNLFCICGKTGAGKSTVFDCIILALYGKSNKGNLADCVNLSVMQAFVSLEFTEGSDTYLVERTIKCRLEKDADGKKTERRVTGANECMLYKNGEPYAKGSDETSARISEIIGLDESEFKNVYLLEQGEYAEFLKKQPAKQTEAVGKIFALMRFGDVYKRASEKAKDARRDEANATERIRDLDEDSPQKLRAVKSELNSLRAKIAASAKEAENADKKLKAMDGARLAYAEFAEKQRAVKAHAARRDGARAALEAAEKNCEAFIASGDADGDRQRVAELRIRFEKASRKNALDLRCADEERSLEKKRVRQKELLEKSDEINKLVQTITAEAESARERFSSATESFCAVANSAAQRSVSVEEGVRKLSSGDERAKLNSLSEIIFGLRADKNEYVNLTDRLAELEETRKEKTQRAAALLDKIQIYARGKLDSEAEERAAQSNLEAASSALEAARAESLAAAVAAGLAEGDVCPVCGGVFHARGGGACELDGFIEAEKQARAELEACAKRVAENQKLADQAKSEYDIIDREVSALDAQKREFEQKRRDTRVDEGVYTEYARALSAAQKAGDALSAATQRLAAVEPSLAGIRAESASVEAEISESEGTVSALKSELGDSYGNTAAELEEVKRELGELETRIAEYEKRRVEVMGEEKAARAAFETASKTLDAAVRDCPADMPEFDEQEYEQARLTVENITAQKAERERDAALKTQELGILTERCEKLKGLQAECAIYKKSAENYEKIAAITKSKSMLNYVVAEHIEEFTAVASEILSELSDGKYTMNYSTLDGFTVSDFLNGGKPRKTDTLSGGEMFLASLSVAIAIARAVGRGSNSFFFLDEGFGTLDDELIDTVYGALLSLSQDCLVGVISHAAPLIERMPACVEIVEATDASGSKIKY